MAWGQELFQIRETLARTASSVDLKLRDLRQLLQDSAQSFANAASGSVLCAPQSPCHEGEDAFSVQCERVVHYPMHQVPDNDHPLGLLLPEAPRVSLVDLFRHEARALERALRVPGASPSTGLSTLQRWGRRLASDATALTTLLRSEALGVVLRALASARTHRQVLYSAASLASAGVTPSPSSSSPPPLSVSLPPAPEQQLDAVAERLLAVLVCVTAAPPARDGRTGALLGRLLRLLADGHEVLDQCRMRASAAAAYSGLDASGPAASRAANASAAEASAEADAKATLTTLLAVLYDAEELELLFSCSLHEAIQAEVSSTVWRDPPTASSSSTGGTRPSSRGIGGGAVSDSGRASFLVDPRWSIRSCEVTAARTAAANVGTSVVGIEDHGVDFGADATRNGLPMDMVGSRVWAAWPGSGRWYRAKVTSATTRAVGIAWLRPPAECDDSAPQARSEEYLSSAGADETEYTELPWTSVMGGNIPRPAPAAADSRHWQQQLSHVEVLAQRCQRLRSLRASLDARCRAQAQCAAAAAAAGDGPISTPMLVGPSEEWHAVFSHSCSPSTDASALVTESAVQGGQTMPLASLSRSMRQLQAERKARAAQCADGDKPGEQLPPSLIAQRRVAAGLNESVETAVRCIASRMTVVRSAAASEPMLGRSAQALVDAYRASERAQRRALEALLAGWRDEEGGLLPCFGDAGALREAHEKALELAERAAREVGRLAATEAQRIRTSVGGLPGGGGPNGTAQEVLQVELEHAARCYEDMVARLQDNLVRFSADQQAPQTAGTRLRGDMFDVCAVSSESTPACVSPSALAMAAAAAAVAIESTMPDPGPGLPASRSRNSAEDIPEAPRSSSNRTPFAQPASSLTLPDAAPAPEASLAADPLAATASERVSTNQVPLMILPDRAIVPPSPAMSPGRPHGQLSQ